MSLRYEDEIRVYDEVDNFLGIIDKDEGVLLSAEDAVFTAKELREIAEYLENL